MAECKHDVRQEYRRTPDRFLSTDSSLTLEQTLDLPLHLTRMPHEINSLSPTPLDPYALKVAGADYDEAALKYMLHSFDELVEDHSQSHSSDIERAQLEIDYQHFHRMKKNDEAMRRWREIAATEPTEQLLSHAEAEGVMQVRAGVSKIGAIILLLANYPEIGAIETSKATRPFCVHAHEIAKGALSAELDQLAANAEFSTVVDNVAKPYRSSIDEHHGAFISKHLLATSDVGGIDIEIVGRESGLLYDPRVNGTTLPESQKKSFGPINDIEMLPIDMTSYARVRSN